MSTKSKTSWKSRAHGGVSITTVSRALNDSVQFNIQTKQQILKLAREHSYPFRGYMPRDPRPGGKLTCHLHATRARRQLSDPFILELIAGVGDAARARGCDFIHLPCVPADG